MHNKPLSRSFCPPKSSPKSRRRAGPARRRPGRGRRPGVRPLRQHQTRLRRPVAHLPRLVRWSAFCQPPNSYTTSWDSTAMWRQHRHPAPGHVRHYQGTRVGGSRISLQGSWGTSLFERIRMGKTAGQAPAEGRRSHRRRTGCHTAHRSETPCAPRPRHGDAPASR